jgi:hypothetical protein
MWRGARKGSVNRRNCAVTLVNLFSAAGARGAAASGRVIDVAVALTCVTSIFFYLYLYFGRH